MKSPIFCAQVRNLFVVMTIAIQVLSFMRGKLEAKTSLTPFDNEQDSSYKLHGFNFSPYIRNGEDPNEPCCREIKEDTLRERMKFVSPYTDWIRTFSCRFGLEKAGRIAHELGHRSAIGAWLGPETTAAGKQANESEISNLIEKANAGEVDLAIVGSEVLLRRDLSEAKLLEYLKRVRQAIPAAIPITTADVYGELLAHPLIMDAVEIVAVNYYPFGEGVSIDRAIAQLHCWHKKMIYAAKNKPVIVSETGWPSCGNIIGQGVPSPENASFYFLNFVSWARANNIQYFYFEVFDETWKAKREGPQGACWGVLDKAGTLKPGMQKVFDGETIPDNWSTDEVPGGSGKPLIEFTFVPPYGSFENLNGRVQHVRPVEHCVAVYIYVFSRWWTKPTEARPLVRINCDGSWTADITTGGSDQLATKICAFLLPDGYQPPLALGTPKLPAELDSVAIAKVEVARLPTSVGNSAHTAPLAFQLEQNYPNPFNPSTTIAFALPRPSHVTLKIFDLLGKEIVTLVDEKLAAGQHKAYWEATGTESGVYFYQLRAGEFVVTQKLLLMK